MRISLHGGGVLTALVGLALVWPAGDNVAQDKDPVRRLKVPAGFIVELVAEPPVVFHPMMAGFDHEGNLYVAEAAGENLPAAELLKKFPNKVLRLDPADERGRFRKSTVFADHMTFPMGALWYRGSVYTGSPPSMWKLTDSKGTGKADLRQELVSKFGFTGNAADIHGPFLGPDGRLYWCDGRHGHEIVRPDGTVMKGKAARIFRCKPDGSEVEVVCGGGMDNPVEIAFTDAGEPFATVDILHARPARNDAIIYAIEGGVYPWHDVYKEFPSTGPVLPAVADLGWVAPAGLTRYRGAALGKDYEGNLFSAQFNRNRIQRHIVTRDGASFKIKTEDFLTSEDKNFHPTDVFEDADGSLLVIDTGGWFRIGCPTSKIAQPQFKGGIYRVRRADAAVADPRGLKIDWKNAAAAELTRLLDDDRVMVRDRAVDELALHAGAALPALETILKAGSSRACLNAVWALTRIELPEARSLVRRALTDKNLDVRLAAIHAAGLHRDARSLSRLLELVIDVHPAVRRQAATALGRLGRSEAIPALMESVRKGGDRFLEHACLFALIRIGHPESLQTFLKDVDPLVQRAAVIAIDQSAPRALTREMVLPLLQSNHQALLTTVLEIVASRPGWGNDIVELVRDWLGRPKLDKTQRQTLLGVLAGMSGDQAIQKVVAESLADAKTSPAGRVLLLEVVSQSTLPKLPDSWLKALAATLKDADDGVVQQALAVIRSRKLTVFDADLQTLAADEERKPVVRVAAFAAVGPRVKKVADGLFELLLGELNKEQAPLVKLAAANALSQAWLDDAQLHKLTVRVAAAGPLELPALLTPFEKSKSADVGTALASALEKAPGLPGLAPSMLERTFAGYPDGVRKQASALNGKLLVDVAGQKSKLDELTPLMSGGDVELGKLVFFGAKASCSACHTVKGQGGAIGPDLSTIGAIRAPRDLLESVVFPSASFARGFEPFVVETSAGQVFTGILVRETADAVYLVGAERAEIRMPRAEIDTFAPGRISIMPQGLDAQLNRQELRDLLAYLQSLR